MSLTEHLRHPDSPVRQFFAATVDPVALGMVIHEAEHQIAAWRLTVRRPLGAGTPTHAAWVGTAADYLLRTDLAPYPIQATVARQGFGILAQQYPAQAVRFFTDLDHAWQVTQAESPGPRRDRGSVVLSVILAWAESYYRSARDPETPLRGALSRGATVHDLVSEVPAPVRQDLHGLLAAYRRDQHPQWVDQGVVLNPTFAQSEALGGADADWIIADTLWDLKTTTRPRYRLEESLLQLVGYALSDTPDTYGITTLGLYFPRFGQTLTWDVAPLLRRLGRQARSLEAWREEWADLFEL